ncbi:hypothetical protein COCON_G00032080 [Conger conger]|uniref:Uncharacterized protein n=1 Tax=Conger conger TaxID=82655 RepID=A0A9Q1DYX7_CONCO|nr:hypothetical protein COCON_G00032080 [Conger conger]
MAPSRPHFHLSTCSRAGLRRKEDSRPVMLIRDKRRLDPGVGVPDPHHAVNELMSPQITRVRSWFLRSSGDPDWGRIQLSQCAEVNSEALSIRAQGGLIPAAHSSQAGAELACHTHGGEACLYPEHRDMNTPQSATQRPEHSPAARTGVEGSW